ncbi:MAG: glutamate racemase, partial [Candidatus Nitrosotenuis sp.]
ALSNFIKKHTIKRKIKFVIIDASELVDLVESGKFITEKNFCSKKIISILQHKFITNNVDVVTLSSTHLPFLLPLLQKIFPNITFLDPANTVADQIANHKAFSPSKKNSLKIFSTGNTKTLQTQLRNIKIRMAVQQIDI